MGIYGTQREDYNADRTVLTITRDPGFGEVIVESWIKVCEIRDRQTCFCCSCGEREGTDVACRNHGFVAVRPCEVHGTPGLPWGEEICDCPDGPKELSEWGTMVLVKHKDDCLMGKMPQSVQATIASWDA